MELLGYIWFVFWLRIVFVIWFSGKCYIIRIIFIVVVLIGLFICYRFFIWKIEKLRKFNVLKKKKNYVLRKMVIVIIRSNYYWYNKFEFSFCCKMLLLFLKLLFKRSRIILVCLILIVIMLKFLYFFFIKIKKWIGVFLKI